MSNTINLPFEIFDLEGDGYHVLIDAGLGRRQYKLVLDTGASKSVFDKITLQKQLGAEHAFETGSLSTGLGVMDMPGQHTTVRRIRIGGLLYRNFEVAVLDLHTIVHTYATLMRKPVLGVLGCDFLISHQAVLDFHKHEFLLQKTFA